MVELDQHRCRECKELFCEPPLGPDEIRLSAPLCPKCCPPPPVRITFSTRLVATPVVVQRTLPKPS